jgi:hypothetical protein
MSNLKFESLSPEFFKPELIMALAPFELRHRYGI